MTFAVPRLSGPAAGLFLATLALSPLHAHDIQVSPDGPIKSLAEARDAVRAWRVGPGRDKAATEPIRVLIADGTYRVTETFVLEPQDGGSPNAPVTYAAAPGARPVISGGRRITGWKLQPDGLWAADIPEVKSGAWYFQELWVNGRRATRARTPNRRYLHATRPALEARAGAPPMAKPEYTAFYAASEDLAPLEKLSAKEREDVEVIVFQTWQIARHRLAWQDTAAGYMQFTAPSRWPFLVYEAGQRYILENFRSALDEPGEWFLSREGRLLYKPLPGEELAGAEVVAPVASQLLEIRGDIPAGKLVRHLRFEGLSFQHTGYSIPREGHIDSQADSKIPAVVMLDGASDVRFDRCEIARTGIYGIWFRRGCTHGGITRSHLHDLGAGGVRIGEGSVDPDPGARTHHITADNNIIHNGGRYFMGSVGVFIQQSSDNTITHNDIGDFYYTGVSVGWVWGYAESLSHHNRIDFNHIHHLGYGVLSDMGGFYGLGPASGTSVSHNHVHDIQGYRYGGWGLYTDEGSSGVLMENNLVHHTRHSTFHQHYGKDNVIRNNIFAFGAEAQIQRSRSEEHLSFSYTGNIVIFDSGILLYGQWNKPRVRMERNLYWDLRGQPIDFGGADFAAWRKQGYDRGSQIADPLFVDAAGGDFTLKPESPALAMGFVPFDYHKAGVYDTKDHEGWRKLAESRTYPEVELEPVPLFSYEDDFEGTPVGKPLWNGRLDVQGKGDSIGVTEERARSGRRSLKVQDAEGLSQVYTPHFNFDCNHKSGTTRIAFDLWMEPGAAFNHEWRNKLAKYETGPSIDIRNDTLYVQKKEIMKLPSQQWVHYDLSCPLGGSAGAWTLEVTLPDGSRQSFPGLPIRDKAWNSLEWLVFVSNATSKTAFYIDNLIIKNHNP